MDEKRLKKFRLDLTKIIEGNYNNLNYQDIYRNIFYILDDSKNKKRLGLELEELIYGNIEKLDKTKCKMINEVLFYYNRITKTSLMERLNCEI